MLVTTDDEIVSSLAALSELRCEGRRVSFVGPDAKNIRVDLRVKEPHQLISLARSVAFLGHEEANFRGAHLWITTWGVWNPQVEAIGRKTLEQFRRGQGENRPLELAPGHIFRDDEFTEAVCCLLQPMIVGWDAYYIPRWEFRESRLSCRSQPRFVPGHQGTHASNAREGIEEFRKPRMDQGFTES